MLIDKILGVIYKWGDRLNQLGVKKEADKVRDKEQKDAVYKKGKNTGTSYCAINTKMLVYSLFYKFEDWL